MIIPVKRLLPGISTVLALGLLWEAAVGLGWLNRTLMPAPSAIGPVLFELIVTGEAWEPLLITARRLLAGAAIAVVGGVALGLLTASVRWIDEMVSPLLDLVRTLPKAALVPPLMLFLGIGETTNIVSIVLAGLFPVWINVVQGVRGLDPVLRGTAKTLRVGRAAFVWKFLIPAVLPEAFAGARVAIGLCFVVAVLSEMAMGSDGLGSLVIDMQRSFKVRQMYAWIAILAVLGLATNALIVSLERRLVFWVPDNRSPSGSA